MSLQEVSDVRRECLGWKLRGISGRRCGVDALGERHEGDAERLELLEQGDEVLKVPTEAVEAPADDDVDAAAASIRQQLVERWPAVLCPGDAAVDVLSFRASVVPLKFTSRQGC